MIIVKKILKRRMAKVTPMNLSGGMENCFKVDTNTTKNSTNLYSLAINLKTKFVGG